MYSRIAALHHTQLRARAHTHTHTHTLTHSLTHSPTHPPTHSLLTHSLGRTLRDEGLTSAWQHTTLTRDRHTCFQRDPSPQSQQASGRKQKFRCIAKSTRQNKAVNVPGCDESFVLFSLIYIIEIIISYNTSQVGDKLWWTNIDFG
jgi:hypothetical protein